MASIWDFRAILDIKYNATQCVGTTKLNKDCRNQIKQSDRDTASRLLNQMNKNKRVLDTKADVRQLAELMLCKGVHNSANKPQWNQVEAMCNRWTRLIETEYKAIQKREKDAAIMKARKEAGKVEKTNNERREKIPVYRETEKKSIAFVVTEVSEDPFVAIKATSTIRPDRPTVLGNVSTNFSMKRNAPAPIKSSLAPPPPPLPSQPSSTTSSPLHIHAFPLPPSTCLVHEPFTPDTTPVKAKVANSHERKASGSISLFPQIKTPSIPLGFTKKQEFALPPSPPTSIYDVSLKQKLPLQETSSINPSDGGKTNCATGTAFRSELSPASGDKAPSNLGSPIKLSNTSLIETEEFSYQMTANIARKTLIPQNKSVKKAGANFGTNIPFSFDLPTDYPSKDKAGFTWDEKRILIFTNDAIPKTKQPVSEGWRKEPVFDFGETAVHHMGEQKPAIDFNYPVVKNPEEANFKVALLPAVSGPELENKVDGGKSPSIVTFPGRVLKSCPPPPAEKRLAAVPISESSRNALSRITVMAEPGVKIKVSELSDFELNNMKSKNIMASEFTFEHPFAVEKSKKAERNTSSLGSIFAEPTVFIKTTDKESARHDRKIEQEKAILDQAELDMEIRPDSALELGAQGDLPTSSHAEKELRSEPGADQDTRTDLGEEDKENIPPPASLANPDISSIDISKIEDMPVAPSIPFRFPHHLQGSDDVDDESLHLSCRPQGPTHPSYVSIPTRSPYRSLDTTLTPATTNTELEDEKSGYGYAFVTPPKRYSTYLPSSYKRETPPELPRLPSWRIVRGASEAALRSEPQGGGKPLPALPAVLARSGDQGREVRDCGSEAGSAWKGRDIGVQTEDAPWNRAGAAEAGGRDKRSEGLFGRLREGVVRKFRRAGKGKGKEKVSVPW